MYQDITLSINRIKRQIEKIEKLDARRSTIEEYCHHIQILIEDAIFHSVRIPADDIQLICRARAGFFSNVSELMNPPSQYVTNLGRVNDKQESKFYACYHGNAQLGSLDEIRLEDGTEVTQLYFKIKREISMLISIGFGKHGFNNPTMKSLSELKLSPEQLKKQTLLQRWVRESFLEKLTTSNFHKYKKTIAIYRVLQSMFDLKGIVFPSVSSTGKCKNIVLEPTVVSDYLEPVKARVVIAQKLPQSNGFIMHYKKDSNYIDLSTGAITWNEISLLGRDDVNKFWRDNKENAISLGDGRFVIPHSTNPNQFWVSR
ncbi:hypothetical protein A9259_07375 [Vibrio cyclitrophicus]|uniref:hypothetical protein n=1 Tax=Vibrio cyclitrophicus TaxID=47951 RepID=UPI0007EEED84|nr:hypothetical protein [Vibrio cyclitrophicus]OBS98270.1 hypothetical protein A9259_07375 [Vibrio cyclitrophicus]